MAEATQAKRLAITKPHVSTPRVRPWRVLAYVLLVAVIVLVCAPLLWMVLASVKTRSEIYTLPISWIPTAFHWDNYEKAATAVPFGHYLVNSLVTTFAGSALKV